MRPLRGRKHLIQIRPQAEESKSERVKVTAAAAEALRGNVVRNISASLADEVAERAWSPVEPSGDCHVLSRLVTSCHVLSRPTCKACESVTPVIERIAANCTTCIVMNFTRILFVAVSKQWHLVAVAQSSRIMAEARRTLLESRHDKTWCKFDGIRVPVQGRTASDVPTHSARWRKRQLRLETGLTILQGKDAKVIIVLFKQMIQ